MIIPSDFVSALEDCGLIVPIGELLIFSVCKQIQVWQDAGLAAQNVSINLAPRQFKEQDLVALFKQAMAEYNIDGSSLSVEVTERTLIENVGEVESVLRKLSELIIKVYVVDLVPVMVQ